MSKVRRDQPGARGLSGGELTVDPTENVKALSIASAERQDDLRQLNDRRIEAEFRVLATQVEGLEKRMILRAEHAKEVRQIETEHAKEIRRTETERVNAIRQVDVLAGNTAADRALVAIQTLAIQTTAERETLRNLVTTSASTLAAQNAADLGRINEAISALQKSSYEGAGKQAVADPMMAELIAEVKRQSGIIANSGGQSQGKKDIWGYVVAGILLLIAIAGWLDRVR